MCEDAIHASHDVGDVAYCGLVAGTILRAESHTARKKLDGGEDVAGPVESVDAVVDGAAGFGCFVDSAQVLPF